MNSFVLKLLCTIEVDNQYYTLYNYSKRTFFQQLKQVKDESIIPIRVEERLQTPTVNTTLNNTAVETQTEKCVHNDNQKSKEATESVSVHQNVNSLVTSSTPTNVTVSGPAGTALINKEAIKNTESKSSLQCQVSSQNDNNQSSVSQPTSTFTSLPVTTRGLFFNDSFFKDTWQDFQDAMKDVVSRWGHLTSNTDHLTSYRTLRTQDLREETQAVKSSEDEHNYKVSC